MPPKGTRLTSEQREHLRQKALEQHARGSTGGATAVLEAPGPAVLDSQDDVIRQLAEFSGLMSDALAKKRDTKDVLDKVGTLLNSLDPVAYTDVLAHPVVEKLTGLVVQAKAQDKTLQAGSDLGQAIGKKPYTLDDIQPDKMDWVEYTPRRSVPVTWNGITYYFQEDVTVYCPKCFVDIEEESRRNNRLAREHINFMFRKADDVSDRTILSDGTGRIRGMHTGGSSSVGKGLDIEVPDADRPGIDMEEEGGEDAA